MTLLSTYSVGSHLAHLLPPQRAADQEHGPPTSSEDTTIISLTASARGVQVETRVAMLPLAITSSLLLEHARCLMWPHNKPLTSSVD